MISILIPVYNYPVIPLIQALDAQCHQLGIQYEILCFDDGSAIEIQHTHVRIKDISTHVKYSELPSNVGRSKIRNKLATAAKYPYLLFLDCDSEVIRADFIAQYMAHAADEIVVCGGTAYSESPPGNRDLLLHWYYGANREVVPLQIRSQHPYRSFKTNNFAISKRIFNTIGFNENIVGYGHEDTLFGLEIKKQGFRIIHIDNPVLHAGLETKEIFLKKTDESIANAAKIREIMPEFDTRLLHHYDRIKGLKLGFILDIILFFFKNLLKRNLFSKNPHLKLFDIYKLCKLREFYKHETIYR